MVWPDYQGGSIANLMSSLQAALGKKQSRYAHLKLLSPQEVKKAKRVVLIVIDGMGYRFLQHNPAPHLHRGLRGSMTSVFPATTAAAVGTFATGVPPQQHAFTGWFMYFKELGVVARSLPFNPRFGSEDMRKEGIPFKTVFSDTGFGEKLNVPSWVVMHQPVEASGFTLATSSKAKILPYTTLRGFFRQLSQAVKRSRKKSFIYAYWPLLDSASHTFGANSKQAKKQLRIIDRHLGSFLKRHQGSGTLVIVTADHGLVDHDRKKFVRLENHPELQKCLALPLCGEPRVSYAYVKPGKTRTFETYVKTKLKRYCTLVKSDTLVKQNRFGLFAPHPKLKDRIGDYTLLMKPGCIIKDALMGGKSKADKANHGGITEEEMLVPLCVFQE